MMDRDSHEFATPNGFGTGSLMLLTFVLATLFGILLISAGLMMVVRIVASILAEVFLPIVLNVPPLSPCPKRDYYLYMGVH